MPPNETRPALCISIHDVAPHTWPQCEALLQTIDGIADIPVTLLVVPAWHRLSERDASEYERALERRLAKGDELALHGYTHLDEGPPPRTPFERFLRRVYTLSEGEFAALDEDEAKRRIEAGLNWFAARQWPVEGFVAPAWLVSAGTWTALAGFSFRYTTTLSHFHLLPQRQLLRSPSMVYAARNALGRSMSRQRNAWLMQTLRNAPLVRLGLHPADARHPELLRDSCRLVADLLSTRQAMTKAAFATRWAAVAKEKTCMQTIG
jgi:predicted deacetylase